MAAQAEHRMIPSASRLLRPMIVTGTTCWSTRAAPRHSAPDIGWSVLLSNREQLPRSIDALQRLDPEVIELKSSTDRGLFER